MHNSLSPPCCLILAIPGYLIIRGLYDFIDVNYNMPTPQNRIIDQLESDIELLKMDIFELKGVNKLLKKQLKEASEVLQKNQGHYDDDGNYIE